MPHVTARAEIQPSAWGKTWGQSKSDNRKDAKGHKKMWEASESVTLDEAEHTRQTDTVYSVLKSEVTESSTGRTRCEEAKDMNMNVESTHPL